MENKTTTMAPSKKIPSTSLLPPAGRLSVTVIHDSTKSYGLRLARQNGSNDNKNCDSSDKTNVVIDMIANTHANSMLKGAPLNEGDILQTINNQSASKYLGCGNSNNDEGQTGYIRGGSFQESEPVTFVAERPIDEEEGNGSPIVRAFCRGSMNERNTNDTGDRAMPIGLEFHRVVVGEEGDIDKEEQKNSQDAGNKSDPGSGSDDRDIPTSSGEPSSPHSTKSMSKTSFLQIDRIDPNGIFAHSVLNQGDIVLAINGYSICADENTTVEEANELLGINAEVTSSPANENDSNYETIDILALNPRKLLELKRHGSQRANVWRMPSQEKRDWVKKQAKKAGVAIGGGAIIGAGFIGAGIGIHPFGTLLMASGVSVLGTEFEAPNRMVRNARDSVEKWAMEDEIVFGENSQDLNERDATDCASRFEDEPVAAPQEESTTERRRNSATQSKPPLSPLPRMTNRMKGLGRRYVLPLLDRMAGDRRNMNIQSSSSFDTNDENTNSRSAIPMEHQCQSQQQMQNAVQERDDDGDHSSTSLLQNRELSTSSQRVA